MKRLLHKMLMITIVALVIPLGTAYAKLPAEEVAIGGITYKASIEYIINIYGEPHRVAKGVYYWGEDDSLKVTTWDSTKGQTDYATSITCTAANGLETPIGGAVGMPVFSVLTRYGGNAASAPDYIDHKNEVYGYISDNGCLIYRAKNEKIISIEIVKALI